jgi:hypothetical protein
MWSAGVRWADAIAMALLRREPIRMKESSAFNYLAGRALFGGRLDAIGHSEMVARDSYKP